MEPITTAIVTAVATGLAKDAVKTGYAKLKSMIFDRVSADKQSEVEQAIATLEKAKTLLQQKIADTGLTLNPDILEQASVLMKEAGTHIEVTGDHNNVALRNSKAASFGNVQGNVSL